MGRPRHQRHARFRSFSLFFSRHMNPTLPSDLLQYLKTRALPKRLGSIR